MHSVHKRKIRLRPLNCQTAMRPNFGRLPVSCCIPTADITLTETAQNGGFNQALKVDSLLPARDIIRTTGMPNAQPE